MEINKLYPPIIAPSVPAFYQDLDAEGKEVLVIKVPYEDNRAVAKSDYETIVLRLKTVQNDFIAFTTTDLYTEETEFGKMLVYHVPSSVYKYNDETWFVNHGQYYKLQIAYLAAGSRAIGYYSSIGITKFSMKPDLYIEGLNESISTNNKIVYKGVYRQKWENKVYGDMTEKVAQYKFVIKENDEVIEDTDWMVHDSSTDIDSYESYDNFTWLRDIKDNTIIQYFVKTTNGIEVSTPEYKIKTDVEPTPVFFLEAESNFDDGYIKVLIPEEFEYQDSINYYLMRNDYPITELGGNQKVFIDNTVEQNVEYVYSVRGVDSEGNMTQGVGECIAVADFEDIFLSDASGRQLKIRFNPNINQFKTTTYSSKSDTIGGVYPIYMKNGNTKYREFSIGGLISYHIDENHLFYDMEDLQSYNRTETNNLQNTPVPNISKTYYDERKFREEVENWLNNGELKLFRSQSEGNMLIRTMNISMVPYNGTSRLVFTFSANAVEYDGHEVEDLIRNKFLDVGGLLNV